MFARPWKLHHALVTKYTLLRREQLEEAGNVSIAHSSLVKHTGKAKRATQGKSKDNLRGAKTQFVKQAGKKTENT